MTMVNTLAPLTAAALMKRAGFRLELDRLRDAAAIILLGALTGMAVSATVGSLVLVLAGSVRSARCRATYHRLIGHFPAQAVKITPPRLSMARESVRMSGVRKTDLGLGVDAVGGLDEQVDPVKRSATPLARPGQHLRQLEEVVPRRADGRSRR